MLLVTANTMAQSIRERTNELAVLKTLGFGDGRVLSMVLMESCVLALVGGGLGLGRGLRARHRRRRSDRRVPAAVLPARSGTWSLGVVIVIVLGFAAGAVPAWQAQRLRIVDALRRN